MAYFLLCSGKRIKFDVNNLILLQGKTYFFRTWNLSSFHIACNVIVSQIWRSHTTLLINCFINFDINLSTWPRRLWNAEPQSRTHVEGLQISMRRRHDREFAVSSSADAYRCNRSVNRSGPAFIFSCSWLRIFVLLPSHTKLSILLSLSHFWLSLYSFQRYTYTIYVVTLPTQRL